MDRVAGRGPLARAPGALKRKKVSQCRKTERGTLWGFSTSILSVANHRKIEVGKFLFSEKNLTMPKKKQKGGPFGIFQHLFCRKTANKLKGGPFGENVFPKKKSRSAEKNEKGSRSVWYVTRENRKNLFGSVR